MPRTPNDQRSDAKNRTSQEHKAASDNRSRQLNPESDEYDKSREE